MYRGIIGKANAVTAAGVEAAIIALNTYGKNFESRVLTGSLSSRDVRRSTRIDNLGFSNKNPTQIQIGIQWLRKNYGRNWKSKFLNKENKKGKKSS